MRRAQRIRDERGALSIEFLLVISAIMLVFLLMLQYAMQAYAQRVAQATAEEALAAASAYEGSAAFGGGHRRALPRRPRESVERQRHRDADRRCGCCHGHRRRSAGLA